MFHVSDTADLHQLVKCHAQGDCAFPKEEIFELYSAALANPTLPDYSRAQLMIDVGAFYTNEASDLGPAMNLMDDAVALLPDEFGYRFVGCQVYIFAGRIAEAREEIRYLRGVRVWRDRLGVPEDDIERLEKSLIEAEVSQAGGEDQEPDTN